MRNRRKADLFAIAVIVSISTVSAAKPDETAAFRYSKKVTVRESGLCGLYLDLDALRLSAPDLSDLRIVDSKGCFVPYFRMNGLTHMETKNRTLKTVEIERGSMGEKDNDRRFVVYQVTGLAGANGEVKEPHRANSLSLSFTMESGFSTEVLVETKTDTTQWDFLAREALYALDGIEKRTIEFPMTRDVNFYRISLLSGTAGLWPTVLVPAYSEWLESVRGFAREIPVNIRGREENGGTTSISLDIAEGIPVDALSFFVAGRFSRDCFLMTPNGEQVAHGRLDSGFGARQRIACVTRTRSGDGMLLAIRNGDDKPLEVKDFRVEYSTVQVVFESVSGEDYALLFGNVMAPMPEYDIGNFADELSHRVKVSADLGALVDRGDLSAIHPVKRNSGQAFFNIVISVSGIALTVFIVLLLRRQKA